MKVKFFVVLSLGISLILVVVFIGGLSLFLHYQEVSSNLSPQYMFSWSWLTRRTILKDNGKDIYDFSFVPRPLYVYLYTPKNFLFIVTSNTGFMDGAEGIYFYDGKTAQKIFQAGSIQFSDTKSSPSKIGKLDISDDGRFLFIEESGYEGGGSFVYDLEKKQMIKNKNEHLSAYGEIYWSPNGLCAGNLLTAYGDTRRFTLAKKSEQGYLRWDSTNDINFAFLDTASVYWDPHQTNCAGILYAQAKECQEGTCKETQTEYYYSFTYKGAKRIFEPVNLAEYKTSTIHATMELIYKTTVQR